MCQFRTPGFNIKHSLGFLASDSLTADASSVSGFNTEFRIQPFGFGFTLLLVVSGRGAGGQRPAQIPEAGLKDNFQVHVSHKEKC